MKLKSYFAESVDEALAKARVELGADAMLISSRETERELEDLGRYEIVFGLPQPEEPSRRGSGSEIALSQKIGAADDRVLRELAELRRQIESVSHSIARSTLTRAVEQLKPELARLFNRLLHAGFSAELAGELTEAIAQRTQNTSETPHRMVREYEDLFSRDLLNAVLTEEISSRFEVTPPLSEHSGALMLVGPPGAGKTSSLAKLALQCGLRAKRSVHLLSLDTLRIAGTDQLSSYARIGGLNFRPLQDASQLAIALSEIPGSSLTLIDTPGYSKAEEEEAEDLARSTVQLPIAVQLVLPADLSLTAAQQTWQRFAKFKPASLLITHVDGLDRKGVVLEFAMRSGLPVSYLATGQQVPEDIRKAHKTNLMEELLPFEMTVSMAA